MFVAFIHTFFLFFGRDPSNSSLNCRQYHFDMPALTEHLRKQAEQNKAASYFNMDILKYQVSLLPVSICISSLDCVYALQIRAGPAASSVPLHLTSLWKCESSETNFRLDYRFNSAVCSGASSLSNVTVLLPMDRDVSDLQATPAAAW